METKHEEQRKETFGSTEIAAILGASPWKNGYDVWAEKTGKIQRPDISGLPIIQAGLRFEGGILDWAEAEIGEKIKVRDALYCDKTLRLSAQIDGLTKGLIPVEAKTAALFSPLSPDWGEDGTDHIPAHYIIQVHVQMILCGAHVCHVAAFLGGVGFRLYTIQRNEGIVEKIKEKAVTFWDAYIATDTPPPETPSLDTARLMPRETGKTTLLGSNARETLMAWQAAKVEEKEAKGQSKTAQAALIMALGDAEVGEFEDGAAFTYKAQTRKGLDTKRLKAEMPKVAEKYATESTFRVARYRKAKKQKERI